MKVIFLGVGEAFDENLSNNSHIIHSDTKLLLDCGYDIPRHLWKNYPDKDFIDAVYLSHAHADHYLGLPILLARLWEDERTKPLEVISHTGVIRSLPSVIDHAYRGLLKNLSFPVSFITIGKGSKVQLNELTLSFALSRHVVRNFAIKVECDGKSVCYSGDGVQTAATKELYRNADLVIHEAYTLDEELHTHASLRNVVAMCEEIQVRHLALTHLKRDLREDKESVLRYIERTTGQVRVMLPEPLDEFSLV